MKRETYRLFIETLNFKSASSASGSARLGSKSIPVYFKKVSDIELLSEGVVYECEGYWQTRLDTGTQQFAIESYTPKTITGELVRPVLMRAYDVGKGTVSRLVDHYDDEILDVLSDRARIEEVVGVLDPKYGATTKLRVLSLYRQFEEVKSSTNSRIKELEFYIQLESQFGFAHRSSARSIYRILGAQDALARLVRNPWIGAGIAQWSDADAMCKRIIKIRDGLSDAEVRLHPQRIEAAILQASKEILKTGDTVCSQNKFLDLVSKRLGSKSRVMFQQAMDIARKKRLIFERSDGRIQPTGAFHGECALAYRLTLIEQTANHVKTASGMALDLKIKGAEKRTGLSLTNDQRKAVANSLTHRLSVLQGGAGVGKTTVMRVLAETWKSFDTGYANVIMCCLAGKAALQLTRSVEVSPGVGDIALTVSRLVANLEKLRKNNDSYKSVAEPGMIRVGEIFDLEVNDIIVSGKTLLIIDEASMVDTVSLRDLLELLPPEINVLLVGDRFQLPPVSWGQPFADLVELGGDRVFELTEVLRQASDSVIPFVSNQIKNGIVPAIGRWAGQPDGVYFTETPPENLGERLSECGLVDSLTLASTNNGVSAVVGVFNHRREQTPEPFKIIHFGCKLFVGTPIIFTQNRYKDGLMNGQLGVVADLDSGDGITVQWDGEDATRILEPDQWAYVELADAITCHKAQGSSADVCITVLEQSLTENNAWLYTAVTRARKLVLFYVKPTIDFTEALTQAIDRREFRQTAFKEAMLTMREVANVQSGDRAA